MAAKYKVGDVVVVPATADGAKSWWIGKEATVRAVLDDGGMYEVLFHDGQDFDFIEEEKLAPVAATPAS
jgi:hypothetical protein